MWAKLAVGVPLGILALAMAAMWGVSAAANFFYAQSLASASEHATVMASASAGADVLKAAALISVVIAFRERLWAAMLAALLIWVVATGWSVRSGLGFVATLVAERSSGQEVARGVKDSLQAELDAAVKQLPWLRTQMTQGPKSGRAKLRTETARLERRVDVLRRQLAGRAGIVTADPVAQFLGSVFGVDKLHVDIATAGWFLLLIEGGGNLTILAFGHLFVRRRQEVTPEPDHPPAPVALRPEPQPVRTPVKAVEAPPKVALTVIPIDRLARVQALRRGRNHATLLDQVRAFVADLVEAAPPGSMRRDELMARYVQWAEREGVDAGAPHTVGQCLPRVGVIKEGRLYRLPKKESRPKAAQV